MFTYFKCSNKEEVFCKEMKEVIMRHLDKNYNLPDNEKEECCQEMLVRAYEIAHSKQFSEKAATSFNSSLSIFVKRYMAQKEKSECISIETVDFIYNNFEDMIVNKMTQKVLLEKAFASISEAHASIVKEAYGIDCERKSIQQIAKEKHVSESRISQIVIKSKVKMYNVI